MTAMLSARPVPVQHFDLEDRVFDIIADETQWPKADLLDAKDFVELGINEILSSMIISKIKTNLQLDIPPSVFQRESSISDFQTYLQSVSSSAQSSRSSSPTRAPTRPVIKKSLSQPTTAVVSAPQTPASKLIPRRSPEQTQSSKARSTNSSPHRRRTRQGRGSIPLSIVLQGDPTTCKQTVFLFPDGSGSAMAYARFQTISKDTCVVGLNSPHLTTASASLACTTKVEDLAALWIREIRQRQPHGPYIIGGWSAGGYYAFEAARQLMHEGQSISKILLIDSPCRLEFEALPADVVEYLSVNNLFGGKAAATPEWLAKHFELTIGLVEKYMPRSLSKNDIPRGYPRMQMPEVYLLWSSEGLLSAIPEEMKKMEASGIDMNVKVTRFLIDEKENYGPHAWDKLFPTGTKMHIAKSSGNHFNMVSAPHCDKLVDQLRDAIMSSDSTSMTGAWKHLSCVR